MGKNASWAQNSYQDTQMPNLYEKSIFFYNRKQGSLEDDTFAMFFFKFDHIPWKKFHVLDKIFKCSTYSLNMFAG